jgi:hypothetical protein
MTVLIGTWEFEGPFSTKNELRAEAAIYAVLTSENDEYELVELNEADDVQHTFQVLHEMTPEDRAVSFAVYYCSDLTEGLREGLVDIILKEFEISNDFESQNATKTTDFDTQSFLVAANQ